MRKQWFFMKKSNNNNSLHPDCLHDFEYDSSYGEIVCFNCGLMKGPLLKASPDNLHYTPRSKPDKTAYLKKCIAEHEKQYKLLYSM